MDKAFNIIIIGLCIIIICIQFVCKEKVVIPKPPDYSAEFQRIDARLDSTNKYIQMKEFKNEQIKNYYVTQFLADTSTNADTIYARYKMLLDSLGKPRFDFSSKARPETHKRILVGTNIPQGIYAKLTGYDRWLSQRSNRLSE